MRLALALPALLSACWGPPSQPTRVTVVLPYPGASAMDALDLLARPAEGALAGTPGVRSTLSICEPGVCTLDVTLDDTQSFLAIQKVSQTMDKVTFPPDAQAQRVFLPERRQVWLKAGADVEATHAAIGALSRTGKGASVLADPGPDEVWTVSPDRLAAAGVLPNTIGLKIDEALAGGTWASGDTVLAEGVVLSQVAVSEDVQQLASAFVDGAPASGLFVAGGGVPEGWSRFVGPKTCVHSREAPGPEQRSSGRWIVLDGVWWGRTDAALQPGPGQTTWRCDAPVVRVALVSTSEEVDMSRASTSLRGWPGALVVLPVPEQSKEPVVELQVRPDAATLFGFSAHEVAQSVQWSGAQRWMGGSPRIMLRLPEGHQSLGQVRVVARDGSQVPIEQLADIRIAAPERSAVLVDGRAAMLFDVVLADDAKLSDWLVPDGIAVKRLDGRGPERVWR